MRRLSLSVFLLALAGVLLAACDFRREQEAGEPSSGETSRQEPSKRDPFILYTDSEWNESLHRDVEYLRISDINGANSREVPLPAECPEPLDLQLNPNGDVLALTCAKDETPLGLLDLDSFEFQLVSYSAWGAGQWSLDGQQLAYLERGVEPAPSRLHVVNVDGSGDRDHGTAPDPPVGWTPANQIVFGNVFGPCVDPGQPCLGRAELFDPATGERTKIGNVTELGPWSPDRRRVLGELVIGRPPGTLRPIVTQVIDAETDERLVISFGEFHVFPLAWAPDGGAFFVSANESIIHFTPGKCLVWWINALDVADRALIAEDACAPAHLSRDNQRLWFTVRRAPTEATAGFQVELWLLDMSTGGRSMVIANARRYIVWEPPTHGSTGSATTPPTDPLPLQAPQGPSTTPTSTPVPTSTAADSSTATPVAPVSPSAPSSSPTTQPSSSPP
jgi:hypothetical protein